MACVEKLEPSLVFSTLLKLITEISTLHYLIEQRQMFCALTKTESYTAEISELALVYIKTLRNQVTVWRSDFLSEFSLFIRKAILSTLMTSICIKNICSLALRLASSSLEIR